MAPSSAAAAQARTDGCRCTVPHPQNMPPAAAAQAMMQIASGSAVGATLNAPAATAAATKDGPTSQRKPPRRTRRFIRAKPTSVVPARADRSVSCGHGGTGAWATAVIAVVLPLALTGCSDRTEGSAAPPVAAPAATTGTGSSPVERDGDTAEKTVLQVMADLGFEPARKEARVDFELAALDGSTRTLDDYAGSYVLLNFWATWCAPCRIEMPALERLHQELADGGLRVVGVDLGEETADVERFVEETGITFEIVIDDDLSTGRLYAARSLPMTYILDPEGTIVARAIGVRDWDSEPMRSMFAALVEEGTAG